jgi:DNA modification methylase
MAKYDAYIAESLRKLAVPIDTLTLDPSNARKHGERNLDAIIRSLDRFGQRVPIVVQQQGMVVRAGNGRVLAAKKLGWTHIAAVVVDESSVDATAFAIADNRTAELAEWDDETLASLLQSLPDDAQLAAGFDDDELGELMKSLEPEPEVVEDEVPEPQEAIVSRTGDLWLLGEHRVLCGDSTKGEDVERLLDGRKPFIMVTDPPYGVEYDANWRQDAADAGHLSKARRAVGKVTSDDRVDWTDAYKLAGATVAYVWHADRFTADLVVNLRDAGFEIRSQVIWRKPAFAISRGHYHWQHEPCWYAVRKGESSKWCGDRSQSTVWDISNRIAEHTNHSTQKPVECMARPIRNHGGADDDVYDPFLGSGTTIIAAEQLGRRCFGIEISPQYVDVIVRRWQKLTGKDAVLDGSGETFAARESEASNG